MTVGSSVRASRGSAVDDATHESVEESDHEPTTEALVTQPLTEENLAEYDEILASQEQLEELEEARDEAKILTLAAGFAQWDKFLSSGSKVRSLKRKIEEVEAASWSDLVEVDDLAREIDEESKLSQKAYESNKRRKSYRHRDRPDGSVLEADVLSDSDHRSTAPDSNGKKSPVDHRSPEATVIAVPSG